MRTDALCCNIAVKMRAVTRQIDAGKYQGDVRMPTLSPKYLEREIIYSFLFEGLKNHFRNFYRPIVQDSSGVPPGFCFEVPPPYSLADTVMHDCIKQTEPPHEALDGPKGQTN